MLSAAVSECAVESESILECCDTELARMFTPGRYDDDTISSWQLGEDMPIAEPLYDRCCKPENKHS